MRWFTYQLGLRLKRMYADSTLARDQGIRNLVWDYAPDTPHDPPGEPDVEKVLKEINGYRSDNPIATSAGSDQLREDGSTTCASWIYCGVFPAPDRNLAKRREPDPPGQIGAHLNWGWAWPANRRVLYNRASADVRRQTLERAQEMDLVGRPSMDRLRHPGLSARQNARTHRPTRPASGSTPTPGTVPLP